MASDGLGYCSTCGVTIAAAFCARCEPMRAVRAALPAEAERWAGWCDARLPDLERAIRAMNLSDGEFLVLIGHWMGKRALEHGADPAVVLSFGLSEGLEGKEAREAVGLIGATLFALASAVMDPQGGRLRGAEGR